jgi:hypothetical protein
MESIEVIIPIVENDGNDVKRAKMLLELPQFWREAIGKAESLNRYHIRLEWVGAADAERTGCVDKRKALLRCLELGAPLMILDIGLSKEEEDFVRERIETIESLTDLEGLWKHEILEKAGGFWILREVAHLREIGLTTPAVAMSTQFGRTVVRNPLEGDVSWSSFLFRKGASFLYRKPLSEEAAMSMLMAVANILSGSAPCLLSTELAALYEATKGKDDKLWQRFQALAIARLDAIMENDGISGQRGKADRIGMAYNTYRNWIEKGSEP